MSNINEQPIGGTTPQTRAVTYYTLPSEYENDFTKNCSLLSSEIDGNFYFLRGYDIKSFNIDVDDNGVKSMYLTRLNGEVLKASMASDDVTNGFRFEFNESEGVITITYPSGEQVELKRFNNVRVSTDGTILGDGSMDNPIRISEVETTGQYTPANKLEVIEKGATMPDGTKLGKGYRIVTKEHVTPFGKLYTWEEIQKMAEALNEIGSPWHIPSKEEWDEMLNAIEPCNGYRNHDSKGNKWLGQDAGALLKQAGTKLWRQPAAEDNLGEDAYAFTALPVGFSGTRNDFLGPDEDNDIEGYHMTTAFWTNTDAGIVDDDSDAAYAKVLHYESRKVGQRAQSKSSRMSLRLVKEYTKDNMSLFDDILGNWYPCVHIIANNSKFFYSEIESLPEEETPVLYDEIPTGDEVFENEKYIQVGKRYYKLTEKAYHHNMIWTQWNISSNAYGGVDSDEWKEGYYKVLSAEDVPEGIDAEVLEELPTDGVIGKDSEYVKVGGKYYKLVDYGVYQTRYFINEWNGESWVKKMMGEGDSVVLIDGPDGSYNHEWRVYKIDEDNDELVDVANAIKSELENYIDGSGDSMLAKAMAYTDKEVKNLKEILIGDIENDTPDSNTISGGKLYTDKRIADVIGSDTDDWTADTVNGAKKFALEMVRDAKDEAKAYADEKDAAIIGKPEDDKDDVSVYGAKAYADAKDSELESKLVGTPNDASSADTINGAKNLAKEVVGNVKEEIIGTPEDASDADTINGAKNFAKKNDIKSGEYTLGGSENSKAEILNNKDEVVITLLFNGNFGII